MGEGLFVHASNSLGVISVARSIIVSFEEGKKNTQTVQHCRTSSRRLEDIKQGVVFDLATLVPL